MAGISGTVTAMVIASASADVELVAAVAEHDSGALHELYVRHEAWIAARLSRRCADRHVVEEVLQDVFVTVWRSAGKYEGTGDVAAWLWGIAIRQLLHRVRPRRPLLDRLRAQPIRDQQSVEEHVLIGVEHGDLGGGARRVVTGATGGGAGNGARRADHHRGRRRSSGSPPAP